jgi:hypothetical protein
MKENGLEYDGMALELA